MRPRAGYDRFALSVGVLCGLLAARAWALERFPPPDFEPGYTMPEAVLPAASPAVGDWPAIAVMFGALSVGTFLVHRLRRRAPMIALSAFCLAFFGFLRRGCVCPVGATQHVSLTLFGSGYAIPLTVAILFALPLAFALLFGRVFCGGVCPLGAVQDLVLLRPLRLPDWLRSGLGLLPVLYLGVAVLYAANGTGFLICRYDPFVSLFRLSGVTPMLWAGAAFVVLSMFVGRPYCRFLCPYGVLLALCSRWSWRRVRTTPDECIVCSLCEDACPFGAIEPPTPRGVPEE